MSILWNFIKFKGQCKNREAYKDWRKCKQERAKIVRAGFVCEKWHLSGKKKLKESGPRLCETRRQNWIWIGSKKGKAFPLWWVKKWLKATQVHSNLPAVLCLLFCFEKGKIYIHTRMETRNKKKVRDHYFLFGVTKSKILV